MNTNIEKSFAELVELKYQLYNSLFLTLPLDAVEQTGTLLPLLQEYCHIGIKQQQSPKEIVERFFADQKPYFTEKEQIGFLFKVIQYIERQIVLMDALEDAAYKNIHRIDGPDSWQQLSQRIKTENLTPELAKTLSEFGVRVVLTAHPTQFYTKQVLTIISDLTEAISQNDIAEVRNLLQQLGKTPFHRREKPTPYNEAVGLVWYISHVFYPAIEKLLDTISTSYEAQIQQNPRLISLGFWPGGDRDGNPFVTIETTKRVAERLRYTALTSYFLDIKKLKRRLSFEGVYEQLDSLEKQLYNELTNAQNEVPLTLEHLQQSLKSIEKQLVEKHQGLFIDKLKSVQRKINLFGFYLASIDIRQDSRVLAKAFNTILEAYPNLLPSNIWELPEPEQIELIMQLSGNIDPNQCTTDPVLKDTLESFGVIRYVQQRNGEGGAHRYVISNCRGPVDIARLYAMLKLCGWHNTQLNVDIVPLFETINDLHHAHQSMQVIYENKAYMQHLASRKQMQTIMLGFSDGTKDGGYLMANWSIYSAKENLTQISREHGISVLFFDGRGGPPARGGGNTHLFYAALGKNIESRQIQTTVQGQTISSHYGTISSAVHNLELLLTAGLKNNLFCQPENELSTSQRQLINQLATDSYKAYEAFKNHPLFLPYLEERSTLKYYGMANIGSRPSKRSSGNSLKFDDLRAIPFVGAWSQLKQNVPGFYGLGTALKQQFDAGNFDTCRELYQRSVFFKALINNSMQSMNKTNFAITQYMSKDPKFGEFWKLIHAEFELSKQMELKLSGYSQLLEDSPRSRMSISLREKIVLPLLIIQQYALMRIQDNATQNPYLEVYEKMVTRSLFGNINASRNSA